MNLKSASLFFVLALYLMQSPSTNAAIIVRIDADTSQAGIQTSVNKDVGEQIEIGMLIELPTNADSVSAFNFNVLFNNTALGFVSRTDTAAALGGGFINGVNSSVKNGNGGVLNQVEGISLGSVLGPLGPIQVGTARFTVLAEGTSFLTPGNFDNVFNTWFDSLDNNITNSITFNPASVTGVTAIPEPSSLLAVSVVSGLAYLRRRRRK